MPIKNNNLAKVSLLFIASVVFVYAIIMARDLLYPLFFGLLLSYLLYPLTNWLEKKRFPRILAILVSIILAIIVLVAGFLFLYSQIENIIGDFPALKSKALRNVESLRHNLEDLLDISVSQFGQLMKQLAVSMFDTGAQMFNGIFQATAGTLFKIGIMPVYIFLFLFYRTKFAIFILKFFHTHDRKQKVIAILKDISEVASRYMGGMLIVVLILCFINTLGLTIIGVRYALVLGIISALFNLIPYFGTILGGGFVIIFVLFTGDDPSIALRVLALFAIIQFTENNLLTPNIVGSHVNINPFFIIIGLVVGATVWGIPGMLIVVPFLAILRIISQHIHRLQAFAFLLGAYGASRHALTLENIKKFFNHRHIFRGNK
jgi:predicted PurR-regulated permease PerM